MGVPIFVVGSIALGFHFVGYYPEGNFGGPIPIILAATGLFLFLCTFWAAAIGASWVAGFFAIYGGFWLSYSALVLGLANGWYGDLFAENLKHVVAAFVISWAAIFFMLQMSTFRLPLVYSGVNIFVIVTLCLVAVAFLTGEAFDEGLINAAGITTWIFAGFGGYIFLSVADISLGGKGLPLGPVLLKAKE